jgi:hypothetical protein
LTNWIRLRSSEPFSADEALLKHHLKSRILGLAAIEKSRARQRSRLTWIKKGDANTTYFHVMANVWKNKNHIVSLKNDTETVSSQSEKHRLTFEHFQHHIGTCCQRKCHINFAAIQWQPRQLQHLEIPFSEHEVHATIQAMPKMKAPGPDGFIGCFFKSCWLTIKNDLMSAVDQFYNMNQQGLHLLNQALVILIPKKPNEESISDYRLISLIHSFAKIMSKMLANRLAPELNKLISYSQNAFIKRQSIHNNFMYVQHVIKDLHKKKVPALFIKLDIAKAFDTVNWSYLLEILTYLGFGACWREWISALWGTTSYCFMINGEPGRRIIH